MAEPGIADMTFYRNNPDDENFNLWGNASNSAIGGAPPSYQAPPLSLSNMKQLGIQMPKQNNGFGLNLGTFNMIGSGLGGLGKLASGWAALKGIGLAKEQLGFQREAFDRNYEMQQKAYQDNVTQVNNNIRDRQNFIQQTNANPDFSRLKTIGS